VPGGRYVWSGASEVIDTRYSKLAYRFHEDRKLRLLETEDSISIARGNEISVLHLPTAERRCTVSTAGVPLDAILSKGGKELVVLSSLDPALSTAPYAVYGADLFSGGNNSPGVEVSRFSCPSGLLVSRRKTAPGGPRYPRFSSGELVGSRVVVEGYTGCPTCCEGSPLLRWEVQIDLSLSTSAEPVQWESTRPSSSENLFKPSTQTAEEPPPIDVPVLSEELRSRILSVQGHHLVTPFDGGLLVWSVPEGKVLMRFPNPNRQGKGASWYPVRFLDDRRVVLGRVSSCDGDGDFEGELTLAIVDVPTGEIDLHSYSPVDCRKGVIVSPVDEKVIVVRPRQSEPIRLPLEVWSLGAEEKLWSHPGCSRFGIRWSGDGQRVLCGQPHDVPDLVLDAKTGSPVEPRPDLDERPFFPRITLTGEIVQQTAADVRTNARRGCVEVVDSEGRTDCRHVHFTGGGWAETPAGARFRTNRGFLELIDPRGELVCRYFHFTGDEWAATSSDGLWAGSDHAQQYLAWYWPDGTLATADEVACLRRTAIDCRVPVKP
jgi:hypothetical protein